MYQIRWQGQVAIEAGIDHGFNTVNVSVRIQHPNGN